MDSSTVQLLHWEKLTSIAIDPKQKCCLRRESLQGAFQLALELVENGTIYLEYTSSFTLLSLATKNYVHYLTDLDQIDEAIFVLKKVQSTFQYYDDSEIPREIRNHALEELDWCFNS